MTPWRRMANRQRSMCMGGRREVAVASLVLGVRGR